MSEANGKKHPIRAVFHKGQVVALVRARTDGQAVRHVVEPEYEAHIADQDEILQYGPKFEVQNAGEVQSE